MDYEEDLVSAFFVPAKHERYLEIFAKPKKRRKFLRDLGHFKDLDPRYTFLFPKNVHSAEEIASFLHQKGAPQSCRIISENSGIDGKEMMLIDAIREVLGRQMGTFLSCIPGKLAYFEDEEGRWILERRM
jgi:hypothetical protein